MAEIPSTPADGNVKVVWVPTLSDPDAPAASDLTGASVVDLSSYLTGDGWNTTKEQATIPDRRLSTRQEFQKPGSKTPGLSITVIDNTNTDDPNEAMETLLEGTRGYFIERRNIPYEEPFEAGQLVTVWPTECGESQAVPVEANSVSRSIIPQFITAEVRSNVAVAA